MCIAARQYECGFIEHLIWTEPCGCTRKRWVEPPKGSCAVCRSRGENNTHAPNVVISPVNAFLIVNNLKVGYAKNVDDSELAKDLADLPEKKDYKETAEEIATRNKAEAKAGNGGVGSGMSK